MDNELLSIILQDLKNWNESITSWNNKQVSNVFMNHIKRPHHEIIFFGGPGRYVPVDIRIRDYKIRKITLNPTYDNDDRITITFFDNKLTYFSKHADCEFNVYTMTDLYDIIKAKFMNSKNIGKPVENFFENMPCFLSIQYVLDKMQQLNEEIVIEI